MQLLVDGLMTHYEQLGEGRLIVILPGWADTAASWHSVQKRLASKFEVVVLDLPGFGGTEAPKLAWGLDNYANFVGKFLAKLGKGNPYAVLGHSNGGAIVIRGLSNGSFAANKAVLLASAGIRGQYDGRNKLLRLITKTGKAAVSPLPGRIKQRLRHKVYSSIGSDMLVAEHMQLTFKKIVIDDVRADAAKLTLPTFLIYGSEDKATPVAYGKTLHELIASSKLAIIPGAAHFVHLDEPDRVNKLIEEFLC
jgi:pimeloyl-ACP methyl ester carboxylesterase